MPIYRGPGGSGDATADSSSEALLVQQLAIDAQADADAAAASATAASGSASAAASSASAAATSASNAATSATNSANSATASATSATNSANSATAAQTAETNAELAETNAETAQTAAELAETNAETAAATATTQAGIATTQASNASTSASAALAAQVAAEAALDNFTDIYLGAFASNPTLDNDGNALTTGDQYFNTVSNELRVWNGSTWQAASVIGGTVTSLNVTGSATFTSITDSGNLTFTGTGNRITGDFSNNTASSRVAFQTSTTNAQTAVIAIPNGTSTTSQFVAYNNSDVSALAAFNTTQLVALSTESSIRSGINGAASYIPLTMYTGGSERLRIDTSGNVGINTSSPATRLSVVSGTNAGISVNDGTVNTIIYNSTGGVASIGTTTNHGMQFYTNNTAKVTIDTSGNVGIGTSSPATNLDVRGAGTRTIRSRSTDTTGGAVGVVAAEFASGSALSMRAGSGYTFLVSTGASDPMLFGTNSAESMRIDSSGNLLVGTSTADNKLTVSNSSSGAASAVLSLVNPNDTTNTAADLDFVTHSSGTLATGKIRGLVAGADNYPMSFWTYGGGGLSERMRIDSSGNVLVGTTTTGFGTDNGWSKEGPSVVQRHNSFQAGGTAYTWFVYNGSAIGSITQNGTTAVAYNTSSDYRLKENIAPMTGALDVVQQLKPVTYNWKADGSSGQGFIAHELQEIVPDCVTGEKDAVDEKGNPVYQGIDTSFLVATLTASIQELKAIVDAQALRIAALESN